MRAGEKLRLDLENIATCVNSEPEINGVLRNFPVHSMTQKPPAKIMTKLPTIDVGFLVRGARVNKVKARQETVIRAAKDTLGQDRKSVV